jgi:hypothetical protein
MFAFQLRNLLTSDTALHTRNGTAAFWRDRCIAIYAENTGNARHFGAGVADVALEVFFHALLHEVH